MLVLLLGAALLPDDPAMAQSGASAASIQSQIRRYGCHLPQYANSVAGCRRLHAKARALGGGTSTYRSGRSVYRAPPRRTYRAPARASQPQQRGGLFGFLFGPADPNRYRRGGRFGRGTNYYYSPSVTGYGGYRTLCVRMCDGYYFPLSFSTSRSGLMRDAQRCEASCGSPAKLFYHRTSGGSVEHMVDLQGQPYANTENAFRYRTELVSDCRCKPEPWSEAAKEEYQRRAEAEEAGENAESAKIADAGAATDAQATQPTAYARPTYRPRPRYRRRAPQRNTFNPFGRWFN